MIVLVEDKTVQESGRSLKGSKIYTFSVAWEDVPAFDELIEKIRRVDMWSRSRLIIEAIREYGHRHLPGNPQLPLIHWTDGVPFSKSAQEKLELKSNMGSFPEDKPTKCYVCSGTGKLSRGQECPECLGKGEFYIIKEGESHAENEN